MSFSEKVWELTKKIPKGKISTYSEIAKALKNPKACRAVGNALRNNPDPINTPCFKVVKSDGSLGGYCGRDPKKIKIKKRKLSEENIKVRANKIVNFKQLLHRF